MKKALLASVGLLSLGIALAVAQGPPTPGAPVTAAFSQPVVDAPTVTASSYSSGNGIGGFRQIKVVGYVGATGSLFNFDIMSVSGVAFSGVAYIFGSSPTGSNCPDKAAATISGTDATKLIAPPTTFTTATSTGATNLSYASITFSPPRQFIAGGSTASTSTQTIWTCMVGTSTFTPGSAADIKTITGVMVN